MDTLSWIRGKVDYERVLEHYKFDNVKSDDHMIRCSCKLHGGDNPTSFVLNKDNGLWFCHTGGCGGGDIFTIVERFEKVSFPEAVKWIANFMNIDITGMSIEARNNQYYAELKKFIKAVKSRSKKALDEFVVEVEKFGIKSFRNFKEETIDHFEMSYVKRIDIRNRKGEGKVFFDRLYIPMKFLQTNVGFILRRTSSNQEPKWFFQPPDIVTGDMLYNYDSVIGESVVVVVEGMFDVWAFHELNIPAVATYGAHLTDQQYKLLMRLGCDLVFAYDGDEAGQKATVKAVEMFKNKANVSVLQFHINEDPESITRKELQEKYDKRLKR